MKYRIFNTPVITPIAQAVSRKILVARGWKVVGRIPPQVKKYVAIGAPHTSNWDFPIFLMTAFALGINANWMGKHTLFRFPFRPVMTWLGGIPVNRKVRGDMVRKATEMLRDNPEFVIGISPEGTRKAVSDWHTGFWHMAHKASVPIYLAFIDYSSKTCGIYGEFHSSGNLEADMREIKSFYSSQFRGRHPEKFKT